jgi:hypothetical protein
VTAGQRMSVYAQAQGLGARALYDAKKRLVKQGVLLAKRLRPGFQRVRVGATLALPVTRRNSVKFIASTGLVTRAGGDFDTLGAVWQIRWDGGV